MGFNSGFKGLISEDRWGKKNYVRNITNLFPSPIYFLFLQSRKIRLLPVLYLTDYRQKMSHLFCKHRIHLQTHTNTHTDTHIHTYTLTHTYTHHTQSLKFWKLILLVNPINMQNYTTYTFPLRVQKFCEHVKISLVCDNYVYIRSIYNIY